MPPSKQRIHPQMSLISPNVLPRKIESQSRAKHMIKISHLKHPPFGMDPIGSNLAAFLEEF
jgi:hypothetical protein